MKDGGIGGKGKYAATDCDLVLAKVVSIVSSIQNNDIYLTKQLFQGIKEFDLAACLREVNYINNSLFQIMLSNAAVFNNMYIDITEFITSNKYKTKFTTGADLD